APTSAQEGCSSSAALGGSLRSASVSSACSRAVICSKSGVSAGSALSAVASSNRLNRSSAGAADAGAGAGGGAGAAGAADGLELRRYPGPPTGSCCLEKAVAAALARRSAAAVIAWPEWPLTHSNSALRPASARSMACSSSTFRTGLPSFLRQPLRFQPGIHLVMELMTYWLSHRTSRCWSASTAVASSRSSTAFSSPMLLVPCGQPPARQVFSSMYQAQPAGPGLPRAEPSAAAVMLMRAIVPQPADTARQAARCRRSPERGDRDSGC